MIAIIRVESWIVRILEGEQLRRGLYFQGELSGGEGLSHIVKEAVTNLCESPVPSRDEVEVDEQQRNEHERGWYHRRVPAECRHAERVTDARPRDHERCPS